MPTLKQLASNFQRITRKQAEKILKEVFHLDSFEKDLTDEQAQILLDIDDAPDKQEEIKNKVIEELTKAEKKEKGKTSSKKKKMDEAGAEETVEKKKEKEKKTKKEKKEEKEHKKEEKKTRGRPKSKEKREGTLLKERKKEPSKRGRKKKVTEQETKERKRTQTKKEGRKRKKEVVGNVEGSIKEKGDITKEQDISYQIEPPTSVLTIEPKIEPHEEVKSDTTEKIQVQKQTPQAEIVSAEEISPNKKQPIDDTKKKKKSKEQSVEISIGAAVEESEPVVEVVLSDGTRARIGDENFDEKILMTKSTTEETTEDIIDLEEDTEYELLERKKHKKVAKHIPIPDPEVVEKVKRLSLEKLKKKEKTRQKEVVIDKTDLFKGHEERKPKIDKKDKKRGKEPKRQHLFDDETIMREAAAAVKEYEAYGSVSHLKKKKRKKDKMSFEETMEKVEVPVIEVSGPMTVENLAQFLEISPSDIIVDLMDLNIMATKNQLIDLDTIRFITQKYGVEVKLVIPEEEDILVEEPDKPEDLMPRAPVVTVMGHVDHGKTSLLDRVRSTNVVATESGGITQHIAAYEVNTNNGKVVFLDTPGHEAFTQMRARGAKITDIVVLVVAADDGVQPQTIEAIDHAKAAEVPIIVAINKCDKPDAQPDRVRQELVAYDLIDEAWGGKTIMKNISAKTGEGVNELLELIILQSQIMDLKANPNKKARGTVIEAEISRGFGPVAWVLIQKGTLRVGDICLVGNTWGKVRTMFNSAGDVIKEAGPSTPVLISGLEELPEAGDTLIVVEDDKKAKLIAEKRAEIKKLQKGEQAKVISLEDFHALVESGEQKKLHILIKADVQGSADVLKSSLSGLGNEEVGVEIIHYSVGEVNESDVLLAQVSKAIIIGFRIGTNSRAQKLAEETGVEIRKYEVIYDVIEDVRKALSGLLKPIINEIIMGHAEIRKVFHSSTFGNIAGCFQLDGTTVRGSLARVIREGNVICEDRINSLKRNKDDVREVSAGFECGIKLEKFEDIKEGDIIETYRLEEVKPSLN
ncbi:MAG TPA: translation initiation factor IF-2 [Candidatus Hydrogenedens sp.]|nr:translation initiation factor IF-2 [Candidatus Hydrogenedens sp.]HPP57854.1 translation initiation factor IF-2 [Candidatus Hydrogenedens sp.]